MKHNEEHTTRRVIRNYRDSDYWKACAGKRGRIDFVEQEAYYTDREGNTHFITFEVLTFIEED